MLAVRKCGLPVNFACAVHGPPGIACEALPAGGPVEIPGPLKFGRGITVPGFIEEPSADVVADEGFCSGRAGQSQGLFLLSRRIVPAVLALIGLGEDEQGPEPVRAGGQQGQSGGNCFLVPSQQGKDPHPFQRGAISEPRVHRAPVQDHVAQGRRIRDPDISGFHRYSL